MSSSRFPSQRIGTPDGNISCNGALACYMLKLLPEYKNAQIIRTRDAAVLETCDVLVGVGGKYCHASKKYDHDKRRTRRCTAGLIYLHYGHHLLALITGMDASDYRLKCIYDQLYEDFIRAVDGFDHPYGKDTVVRYFMKTTLTVRVSYLPTSDVGNVESKQEDLLNKAMELTGAEFMAKVEYFTSVWWPAMTLLEKSTKSKVFPSSRLVHLLQGTPWCYRIFTVDEVQWSRVSRKLYIITEKHSRDEWGVNLVSTKEETHQTPSLVSAEMQKKIGTHDGTFHCDEALACFMLKQLPEYKDAQVIRTSDPAILRSCDIVVDVGDVYGHARKRYDHHHRGFHETMNSLDAAYTWITPLSSAGLVYFHYGHRVLADIIGCDELDDIVKRIFKKFYADFVEAVDGLDNGILPSDEEPGFLVSTNLGDRVAALNLSWDDHYAARKANDQFRKAMTLAGSEFTEGIKDLRNVWWPARKIVEKAFESRFQTDESGEILSLEHGCSWKEHLVDLEREQFLENYIKLVIFPDEFTGKYVVQCVPTCLGSQTTRLSLPNEWRGLKGHELQRVNGVPDSLVVKRAGYIGFGETYESVYQMAHMTLAKNNRPNPQQ